MATQPQTDLASTIRACLPADEAELLTLYRNLPDADHRRNVLAELHEIAACSGTYRPDRERHVVLFEHERAVVTALRGMPEAVRRSAVDSLHSLHDACDAVQRD